MSFDLIPFWECAWTIYSLISMLVHCFILFTIWKARMNNSTFFRGPFFTIVLIQGFHEVIEILTINFVNRFRKYRIIEYKVEADNNLVEWQWYFFIFLRNIIYLGHFEIAVNRLSAFLAKGISTYDRIWNTSFILLITFGTYIISGILRAVFYSPSIQCKTMIFNDSQIFSMDISGDVGNILTIDSMVDLIFSTSSAILCTFCYVWTSILSRMNRIGNKKSRKQELLLLKIGIVTFFILLPSPIRSAFELWAATTGHSDLKIAASNFNLIAAEAMCVFQPWLLLISCKSLRERIWGNISRDEDSTSHDRKVRSISSNLTVTHA